MSELSREDEKFERMLGRKSPATRTVEQRDDLLRRLLSLGKRDPSKFEIGDEAKAVGPMYRIPVPSKMVRQLDEALKELQKDKAKAEKRNKQDQLKELTEAEDLVNAIMANPAQEMIFANVGRHPSVLAHEVGHASRPNLGAKFVSGAATHFADNPVSSLTATALGVAGGLTANPAIVGTALGLGALQGISRLSEEARASMRGLKLLEESGYEPSPQERRSLRRAWYTYLPTLATDVGVPALAAGAAAYLKHASVKTALLDSAGRKAVAPSLLSKIAKINTELMEHQKRVLERMRNASGLVVAHGLGTGKTLTSIGVADAEGDARALVPAALVANYAKELEKHTGGTTPVDVGSVQRAVLHGEADPVKLLIVDEAHRARETSTKLNQFLRAYPAEKRLLLTATPVYNRPSDIAALVNIAAGEDVLPTNSAFKDKYIKEPGKSFWATMPWATKRPTLTNKKELQKILKQWVDYQDLKGGDFPDRADERIDVMMSPAQTKLHNYAWEQLPLMSRIRLKSGLPPEKKDLPKLNKFQSQTRQLSGSLKRFQQDLKAEGLTPKLQRALSDFSDEEKKNPQHRAVVYSNYLDTLKDYSRELEKKNIPHAIFSGKVPKKVRQQAVEDYNEGKLKALLVSSAGGEGLDLKGTRQVQVLEPHWNEEKLEQVIGRAIRHQSHSHLPPSQRNVKVQRYLTYPRPGLLGRAMGSKPEGVEQVLANMSEQKRKLNSELLELLG